jgi:hypothetical protein
MWNDVLLFEGFAIARERPCRLCQTAEQSNASKFSELPRLLLCRAVACLRPTILGEGRDGGADEGHRYLCSVVRGDDVIEEVFGPRLSYREDLHLP